ncbi:MAG: TRZ/ATZ family hydrolase, partial [Gammaproteobacteria bacterium]
KGRIQDLIPTAQCAERYSARETRSLDQHHVLIPGLINTHTHAAMSLFRGLADDLPLMDWLNNHIWPAEARWVDTEFVRIGTRLAIAEMLRGGITCFNDMYFFPDAVAREAKQSGIRAAVGLIVIDFPTIWAQNADEYIAKALAVNDEFRNEPIIHGVFAPHAPYTVSDGPLERIRTLADELDLPIHMHVHETAHEVQEAMENSGERPLARLDRLGLLSPNFLAVHMTQLTDEEIQLMADRGAHVVHCPESNMKLASGTCPVDQLKAAGVNIALGTDGAASNNDLNLFGEMRSAALLAKHSTGDASAFNAHEALHAATLGGAKALGLEQETGSLSIGKSADITAVSLDALECQPVYDPASHLVYAAGRRDVSHVWVAGRELLRDRQLTTIDVETLKASVGEWAVKINQSDHAQADDTGE